jgi:hypothetical protein
VSFTESVLRGTTSDSAHTPPTAMAGPLRGRRSSGGGNTTGPEDCPFRTRRVHDDVGDGLAERRSHAVDQTGLPLDALSGSVGVDLAVTAYLLAAARP